MAQYNCRNVHSVKSSVHSDRLGTVQPLQSDLTTREVVVKQWWPDVVLRNLTFEKADW
jgi:hypothetical protein